MRTISLLIMLQYLICLLPLPATAASDSRRISATSTVRASGEKRVALVIGNSAYRVKPLRNPVNDARLIGQVVQEAGFELYGGKVYEDLSYAQMMETVEGFGNSLSAGGAALVFYAGHGMQSGGSNYLIPVDASIRGENELSYKTVNAGLLLAKMEQARSSVNIVVLDACRDNPFARSFRSAAGGLAAMQAPAGTLVAYSTGPGSVAEDGSGKNSIYSESLAKALKQKGITIEEAFKQVRSQVRKKTGSKQTPWENTSLEGSFIFIETSGPVTVQHPAGVSHAADAEREAWGIIKDSNDPADFRSFLKEFPNGSFAGTARLKLGQLEKKQTADNPVTKAERDRLTSDQAEADRKVSEQVQMQPRQVTADVKNRDNEKLSNRYAVFDNYISDNKSNKCWMRSIPKRTYSNSEAFEYIDKINKKHFMGFSNWRLPKRNEVIELITSLHRAANTPDLADRSLLTIMNRNGFVDFEPANYWIFSGKKGLYGAWVPIWHLENKNGESKFDVINNHLKENKVKIWPVRDCK